jgi:polysaccharide export outer membrane protein
VKKRTISVSVLVCAALSGCAYFPSSGPSASDIRSESVHAHLPLQKVSPKLAEARYRAVLQKNAEEARATLAALQGTYRSQPVRLHDGDEIHATLWTQSLLPVSIGGGSGGSGMQMKQYPLGSFTIAQERVTLPYAGSVAIAGESLSEAEQAMSKAFTRSGYFEDPQVTITITKNRGQYVEVTGSARKPMVISWRPGGISLGYALTRAQGLETTSYVQGRSETNTKANRVVVVENGQNFVLPLDLAEQSYVPLSVGAKVILRRQSVVKVNCLGGGWAGDVHESFGHIPTLADVLATGGGLNPQTAQARYVFVLSAKHNKIYEFPMTTLEGLRAAQRFPVMNGSVVYVSTAPSVLLQQITQILFSPFYPAAAIKGVS